MPKKESPYPSDRIVLEELRLQRFSQDKVFETLDHKSATVLGANGIITIVSIATSVLRFYQGDATKPRCEFALVFSIILLLLALVFSIVIIWPRPWFWNPKPKVLYEDYLKRNPETLRQEEPGSIVQMVADLWKGYENNEKTLKNFLEKNGFKVIIVRINQQDKNCLLHANKIQ